MPDLFVIRRYIIKLEWNRIELNCSSNMWNVHKYMTFSHRKYPSSHHIALRQQKCKIRNLHKTWEKTLSTISYGHLFTVFFIYRSITKYSYVLVKPCGHVTMRQKRMPHHQMMLDSDSHNFHCTEIWCFFKHSWHSLSSYVLSTSL